MKIARPRSHKKPGKRLGRGIGSGRGKTSGRGHKGQKARSGSYKLTFSFRNVTGVPLKRASYLKGISNPANSRKVLYQGINLNMLDAKFNAGDSVDQAALKAKGILRSVNTPVKILGNGDTEKKLTVRVQAISKSAREKVEKAGGSVEIVPLTTREKTDATPAVAETKEVHNVQTKKE